jgi:purine-binding chemotaxis protein CheW
MLQFITFYLGGERYAIDILLSKEIAKIHEVTPVPESPNYIVGLMNLRGQILTIMNPQFFLVDTPPSLSYDILNRELSLVILKTGAELRKLDQLKSIHSALMVKEPLAVIVDKMGDILNVEPEEILPPPSNLSNKKREFVAGIIPFKKELIVILAIDRLVYKCSHPDTVN